MAKMLVVDDDRGMKEFLQIMLEKDGHAVSCAGGGTEALNLCRKNRFDLVLTDLKMPKVNGIDLLQEIKTISPETAVILITAFASGETALAAMREGAFDYLEKDFDIDELKAVVRDALSKKGIALGDDPFLSRAGDGGVFFGNMVARSREMLKVFALVKKVAATPANVLILGESGTGKELVARAIHENSPRKDGQFIAINCGGLPEALLESELFGHMKGSFTGAHADKMGLLEHARGGTVFLDEIAELPPVLQVKLLRAVQEKTFRRVGGSEDISVDFRVISATNQDLREKVKAGKFREDLYYRLNVIPIEIPPLRKRKEDIPLLAGYFSEKYSREFGKDVKKISAYALELLMEYEFPGNVRELENIIERSVALETSNIILPENLVMSKQEQGNGLSVAEIELPDEGIMLNETMNEVERSLIVKALDRARGSKKKAAELLHISYDSLKHRLEKFGIS
ncbi:MAG: sigma-54-dependent Fis family transcriptional regulator [Syntrophobacterales bacterium]|nr:sigma-54-dependent Fis family transcriptional regulator [Syntrophobacterales bacterium]